jgi:CheY-like chemotaxis protein
MESAGRPSRLNVVRVLIVEDSLAVRARLLAMLGECAEVMALAAPGAREALEILAGTSIDVVILDLCLGQGRAFEVIGLIKANWPEVAVVVLTNDAGQAQRRECLLRGADHFFDKSREFEAAVDVASGRRGRTSDTELPAV